MKPIANWENIKENSGFERLPVGGYICAIKSVEDVAEKQYLRICYDIVRGDHKGYFQKLFDGDTRENKRWSGAGAFVRSYKDSAASMFKGFINAVEGSNKNYKWNWDEKTLAKKYIGVVIGDEEYVTQTGKTRVRNYVVGVHNVETIENGDFRTPELKKLQVAATATTDSTNQPFVNPFDDAEIPSVNENPWGADNDPFV